MTSFLQAAVMLLAFSALAKIPFTVEAPPAPSAARLMQSFDKLLVVSNVLFVAAHPDDENTGLLAYLANEKHYRATYLSLTRGEGGQNLIGNELSPWLGLIRTHELMGARSIDGAEQFFGQLRDFGFSKSPEETLAIWGKHEALSDVVWAIRTLRPDVIIVRFDPSGKETHGHHTASAQLAVEAFSAAADLKMFPEQLTLVKPWQARRIVWNRYFQKPPDDVASVPQFDVNGYNMLLGRSYGELAAQSRSMHKSQGFGDAPERGPDLEYFQVLAGEKMNISPFDGIDSTWARVPQSQKLIEALTKARGEFQPGKPSASLPRLLEALVALDAMPENDFRVAKREELIEVILGCSGLWFDARATQTVAVPGKMVSVVAQVLQRGPTFVTLKSIHVNDQPVAETQVLQQQKPVEFKKDVALGLDTAFSVPYWLKEPPSIGRWNSTLTPNSGLPTEQPALMARFVFEILGKPIQVARSVVYTWTDPVAGERRRSLEVLPEVTVTPQDDIAMFGDALPKDFTFTLKASAGATHGTLQFEGANGFVVEPALVPFSLKAADEEQLVTVKIRPPAQTDTSATIRVRTTVAGGVPTPALRAIRINYPHISSLTATKPVEIKALRFDFKKPKLKVAYVPGAGDDVATSLKGVGYEVTVVASTSLAEVSLARFDAVILGIRALNVAPAVGQQHPKLMEFVKAGGTVLMQYNTNNRISSLIGEMGPYPFSISRDRVTQENAPVLLGNAKHPLFSKPNVLTDKDFEGWVQERGLYFAQNWDPKYETPLSMNDAGESPKLGSLLIAKYGKGVFIYTGLSFFRQLPAGVPGAYRLMENILAYGR
jgi:LmbE family N-acetylglucosaminyl deacetylase